MRQRFLTVGFASALFFLIVGAKWATFDRFGSPMPDWDQWDAEAVNLFVPWFEHDHFIQRLFQPHNEHRVVLTKLQNLALVLINGQWDSRLEAVTNAMLHAALAVACWLLARRWVAARWQAALFALAFALFGFPLAWQNILGGFHSQQYWLLGLSFTAIVTLPFARAWTPAWWLGAVSAVLALGSMGSGFLAAVVVLALVAWRMWRGASTLREVWPTLALSVGLIAVGALTRVEVSYHQQLKAKTAHDFIFSILRSLEWPLRDQDWAGALLWLPWLLVACRAARAKPAEESRASQTIAALGGWVLVQIVATAYARGAGADYPASRYMDTLSFGALVNGIALAWCLSLPSVPRLGRMAYYALALAWVVTLGIGLRDVLERNLRYELPDTKKYYVKAEGHMRHYLATNDPKALAYPDIPYPSADGLVERLARPSLRALMPLPIRAPLALAPAGENPAFAENDARTSDPEHPPRHGLSPATSPLDASLSWGSFTANGPATTGTWKSAPLTPPPFGWLKFETAGDLGTSSAGVSLTLRDARSGALLATVAPSKTPGDTWRAAYVRTPRVPFVVVANDVSAAQWLAFSPPVEMGAASYWAWQATKHGLLIVYLATAATAVFGFIAWFFLSQTHAVATTRRTA